MPGTRTRGLLALGGIALAAVLALIGHLEVNDDLNPWSLTVSDFAVSDRGGVIDVAMVVLAAASAVLLLALLRQAGAGAGRAGGPPRASCWDALELGGRLVAAAVVPTNEPGTAHGHRRLPAPVRLGGRLPGPAGRRLAARRTPGPPVARYARSPCQPGPGRGDDLVRLPRTTGC